MPRSLHRILSRSMATLAAAGALLFPNSAHAQAPAGRPSGDVNNDGQVTAVDAQLILTSLVELPLPAGSDKTFGDADCDGKLTTLDAQLVLAYVVKLDVTKFCVGKVNIAPAAAVSIDAGTGKVLVSGTLQLTATALDDKNIAISGKVFTWTSSDPTKATVDGNGLVKGVAAGTTTITATADGKTATVSVEILPASSTLSLEVTPLNATVLKGGTVKLIATVRDAAGNAVAGKTITWTSQATSIATVAADGTVSGIGLGTAKIDATVDALKTTASVAVVATSLSPNRTWKGGSAAGPTLWSAADNWADRAGKPGLPTTTDTLFIPAAATSQPVLAEALATVAGIEVEKGAKLDIQANELQVTGRVFADGSIVGTGAGKVTIQGLNQSTSLVRGNLPNMTVNGETVLVGATVVTGSVSVAPGSLLRANGYTLNASKDLTVKGAIVMTAAAELIDARGNALFFGDGSATSPLTVLSAGTLRIGGNLSIDVSTSTANPFPAKGTHKLVLDGSAQQTVTMTLLPETTIQELEIANKSGGVVFTTATDQNQRFQVAGRANVTTATTVSGTGRVNVLGSSFTSASGSSVTLRNLAVRGTLAAGSTFRPDTLTLLGLGQDIPSAAAYEYQNIVAAGTSRFTGTTSAAGSLILGCITTNASCSGGGSTSLNGQTVTVGGDVRQTSLGAQSPLYMLNAADSLTVKGSVLGALNDASTTAAFYTLGSEWGAGKLVVAGDFIAKGQGTVVPNPGAAVPITDTHLVILNGANQQVLRVASGFTFQSLTIKNTAATGTGILINDPGTRQFVGAVRASLSVSTPTTVAGTGRIDVGGDVNTTSGSKVQLSAIAVGSSLRASTVTGEFTPDTTEFRSASGVVQTIQILSGYKNILVSGNAIFAGKLVLGGSLSIAKSGDLNLNGQFVTVNKDLIAKGIIRMNDVADTLSVLGDAQFLRSGDANAASYVGKGVLRLGGAASGSNPTGFYPGGTHKTIIASVGGATKPVSGYFNDVAVVTLAGTGSTALNALTVLGSFTSTQALRPITFDSLYVAGSATLTGPDTVAQVASILQTPSRPLRVKGNLTVGRLVTLNRATVDGDFTIADGGYLRGPVLYRGNYAEAGKVVSPLDGSPTLAKLRSIQITAQPPAGMVAVNTAFSPVFTVRLLDSAGTTITDHTVPVYTLNPDSLSGNVRAVTVNGIATFTNMAPRFVGGKTINFFANTPLLDPNIQRSSALSNAYTVTGPLGSMAATKVTYTSTTVQNVSAGDLVRNANGLAISFQITDDIGRPAPFTGNLTIAATGDSANALKGTTTVAITNASSVTFPGLQLTKVGNYTLTVTGTDPASLATITPGLYGAKFSVAAGIPTRLLIVTQPVGGPVNSLIAPVPAVRLLDAYANVYSAGAQALSVRFSKKSTTQSPTTDPVPTLGNMTVASDGTISWESFQALLNTLPQSQPTWTYSATFNYSGSFNAGLGGSPTVVSNDFTITVP